MANKLVEVADELTTFLNGLSLSMPFTATRKYSPEYELETMGTSLYVDVVPRDLETEILNRTKVQEDAVIDVGIMQRVDNTDGVVDPLLALVDEIAEGVRFQRLPAPANAMWIGHNRSPFYDLEDRDTMRLFKSVIRFRFRLFR